MSPDKQGDANNNATLSKQVKMDKKEKKSLDEVYVSDGMDDGIQVVVEDDNEFNSDQESDGNPEQSEEGYEASEVESELDESDDRDHCRRERKCSGGTERTGLTDSEISFTVDQEALMRIPGLSKMVENMVRKEANQTIEQMEKQGMIKRTEQFQTQRCQSHLK